MRYRRTTLVARTGGERLTIDTDLHATADRRVLGIDHRLAIIETKSAHGRGLADRILRTLQLRPVSACSKYCTAMAALEAGVPGPRFRPALRRLRFAPVAPAATRSLRQLAEVASCNATGAPS